MEPWEEPDQLDYWQRYDRDLAAIDDGHDPWRQHRPPVGNPDPKRECPECNQPLPACECR